MARSLYLQFKFVYLPLTISFKIQRALVYTIKNFLISEALLTHIVSRRLINTAKDYGIFIRKCQ